MSILRIDKRTIVSTMLLAACAPVGLAAGAAPALTLAGAAAILGAMIAVGSITVAVAAFTFMSMTSLGARPKIMLVAGLCVGLAWLASLTLSRGSRRTSLAVTHPVLVCALAAFVSWTALTQLWAPDVSLVRATLARYAVTMLVFPAVFVAATSRRGAIIVMGIFALGASISAVLAFLGVDVYRPGDPSLASQYASRLTGGPVDDPNIFATLSLAGAAFAAALASRSVGLTVPWRWTFAASALTSLAAVAASGSRGAVVAMIAMIGVIPLVARRRRLGSVALTMALVGLAAVLVTSSWSPMRERFQEQGFKSSGRVELWQVGWAIAKDHPLRGVGAGNFQQVSPDYLLQVGPLTHDQYIVDRPLVVHNSYLQLLDETGVPGLALFLVIVVCCGACALQAARLFGAHGDGSMEVLAGAVVVALAGFLVALFFLSYLDYGRPLFVILALGPALLALARRGAGPMLPRSER